MLIVEYWKSYWNNICVHFKQYLCLFGTIYAFIWNNIQ